MYLNSIKDRQSSSCRSKQRRDKLLERRRTTSSQSSRSSAGSQSSRPRFSRFSSHSGHRSERTHKFERWAFCKIILQG